MTERAALTDPHLSPADDFGEEAEAFRQAASGGFDLRYFTALLRANLALIGAILAAVLAIAVVVTMLDRPRYTASSAIQINDTGNRVIGDRDDSTAQINNSWDVDRFLKTQTDVFKSRGLAVRVAQKLKLYDDPRFFAAMEVDPPAKGTPRDVVRDQTVSLLRGNLAVDLPRDSRVVTIGFNSADPAVAAQVANAFVGEFIEASLQRKFDSTAYARDFVSGQLADAKARLETSERELNNYARQSGIIRTRTAAQVDGRNGDNTGGSVTTANLLQLNAAANDARTQRIIAESRWRSVGNGNPLGSREVLANPAVVNLMTERARKEAALQEELVRHLDDYPAVQEKRAELARINSELSAAARSVRSSIQAEYDAALRAERDLAAQVGQLKGATLAEQDNSVRLALLEREAETNRTLYDSLLGRYNELFATAGISASNVAVIDVAEAPLSPSSPSLVRNLVLALLFGLGLAAIAVFLKDQLDDAIRVPEDVEHKLRLPLLGVIPKAQGRNPDGDLDDPKSAVSEAYNSLRGALLYSTTNGLPQVLLVTSAQPEEGKTTTSYAIASGLARMGRRVVLIDADLRRPSVHRRIGYDNARGLTSLLTTTDAYDSALQLSSQPQLTLMPSGPIPPSPTELLASTRMEQLVTELARNFDVVVIDSPPILGLADSPVLSAIADGVIFVVESNRGRRGALKGALRRLRAMRPIVLGAVLTKFDPARSGNRYSEYYGYNYYNYETAEAKDG